MHYQTPIAARSELANATKRNNAEQITEARRDLATANIAAAIEKNVAKAPPLSEAQKALLIRLMNGTAG